MEYSLGNAASFDARAFDKSLQGFREAAGHNWEHCSACEARKIRSYGCQAFIAQSTVRRNIECQATKWRYAFMSRNEERLKPVLDALADRSPA